MADITKTSPKRERMKKSVAAVQSIVGGGSNSTPDRSTTDSLDVVLSANDALARRLSDLLVGQDEAIERVVPYVSTHQAGLGPEGRPAGVFLFTGPTGCGKTYFVECLAKVLHGNEKNVLRIDCGEYGRDHEVAKLIGAPPGYLGHRETQPMLTQARLNAITSAPSNISIVLFDEVEKGAQGLKNLLLGVLDKGTLRVGDNSIVTFNNTIIFMTSNLGAEEIQRNLDGHVIAFERPAAEGLERRLEASHSRSLRKSFSPEFINRLDETVRFEALEPGQIQEIAQMEINKARDRIRQRLGPECPFLNVTPEAVDWIARHGFSRTEGARPIKRLVERKVVHGFANLAGRRKYATYALGVIGPDLDIRWSLDASPFDVAVVA